jgi:UDP-N-acetylmuramate--alanine ligase
MIGVIAAEAGIDPTVVIGGDVAALGGNARNG